MDSLGRRQWPNSFQINQQGTAASLDDAVADGEGGIYFSYAGTNVGHRINRLSYGGELLWGMQGVQPFNLAAGSAVLCQDSLGNVICLMVTVSESPGYYHYRAQKLSGEGQRLWGPQGAPVSLLFHDSGNSQHTIIADGGGGAIMGWLSGTPSYPPEYPYAKHIRADGTLGPPIIPVYSIPGQLTANATPNQIIYALSQAGEVHVQLYDLLGRQVLSISEGYKNPGSYALHLERTRLASGLYFAQLITPYDRQVVKVVVLR